MNDVKLPPSTRIIYYTFDFLGKYWQSGLVLLLVFVGLLFLGTGLYIVKKEEQGILTRFGKIVDSDITPGVGYRWPLIERIHIFPVKRIVSKQISTNQSQTEKFTVLSGDTNLLEVTLSLQYTVVDLPRYLFVIAEPEKLISVVARERLIEEFGNNFVELIFTSNRKHIEESLSHSMQSQFEQLGIGIELTALAIVDLSPIEETIAAFRDVSDAVAEKIQAEVDAQRTREQMLARSRGQAQSIVLDAKAKAHTRMKQAESAATAFLNLLAKYRENPEQVAITRYWDRMRTTFEEASLATLNPVADSTVDINMIDSLASLPFSSTASEDLPSTPEHTLPQDVSARSVATMPPSPSSEHTEAGQLTMDGRAHATNAELDHIPAANTRSLIFDAALLFRHAHTVRRDQVLKKLSVEEPVAASKEAKESTTEENHVEE